MFGIKFKSQSQENNQAPAEEKSQGGWFSRLKESLGKTRIGFTSKLDNLLRGKKEISPALLEELEELLISADVGVNAASLITKRLTEQMSRKHLKDPALLKDALQAEILNIISSSKDNKLNTRPFGELTTYFVLGVNGSGKTTTIGKLASSLIKQNKKVLIAAADTFRAAAADQLELWAKRVGADIVRHKEGADPSAVVYDAVQAALARKSDFLIIDTAGRLHTQHNLMEEIKKMQRVLKKALPTAPDENLLVLDANIGQNALAQARAFNEALGVTGLVLTKLDSSAKGGAIVGILDELKIPLKLIGIGEGVEDLREFAPQDFVKALLSSEE